MSRLQYLIKTSEEFASKIYPLRDNLEIDDLLLFGSVAKGKNDPKDIDMMVIHHSSLLEEFKIEFADRKDISDIEKFSKLRSKLLSRGIDIQIELNGTAALDLVTKNLFDLTYMHKDFFTNQEYRSMWRKINCNPNPNFDKETFEYGVLWNPATEKYDIPANQRYQIPKD